jgi:hypothetical protein
MKLPFARLASLMAIAVVFSDGSSWAADVVRYDYFASGEGLILQQHAQVLDGKLRISPAIPGLGYGGAWLKEKQPVKDGFETAFQIQITEKHSSGADGMAFVIQNGGEPALGQTGQGLGYGGVANQFVVHFDNYHWGDHPTAGRYDEIAVLAAASPTTPLYNANSNILAAVNRQVNYSDGAVHTVKIVYVPGNLQVFLDDLENPLMTVYVNLAQVMNLDAGRAWVGFTAASGADWQNHDVISWAFDSTDPINKLISEPGQAPVAPSTPIYVGKKLDSQPASPLPVDRAFGYALPGDVHTTPRIMVSTNLVEWDTLTNASFYFRDEDSTNYPQRFYRFEK